MKDISTSKFSGYEDFLDELKTYTKKDYLESSDEKKSVMIEEIFQIYRKVNIFPITYYTENGVRDEILSCYEKDVYFEKNNINFRYNQGQSLCRFFFPNILDVECGGDKRTLRRKFQDDHMLKRAIEFCLKYKSNSYPVVPSSLKDGLEMMGGGVPQNFKTMNAKAIFERYTPVNGVIYDFSSGFGGRLLGALSSKNNYFYIGVEPDTKTFDGLNRLGNSINRTLNRDNSFKIYNTTSEDFSEFSEVADFSFSSPPYFNLEKYTDEETQCYNKFDNIDDWLTGYVEPTIRNIYRILKPNSYYAVNISDFKVGNKRFEFVDRWLEISKNTGFEYLETIILGLQTRRGDGHSEKNGVLKKEGVFIFRKVR